MITAELADGWQVASTAPDQCRGPHDVDALDWLPARVPGTAAGALRAAGTWRMGEPCDVDDRDWWFRTRFEADPAGEGEEVWLMLDGIATVCEVYLNHELLLESDSMYAAHRLDVSHRLRAGPDANELAICCRALAPLLRGTRRPRARWRTRVVSRGNLRFYRTMLLGRAPGFAPGPACVGPWRPVRLTRHRGAVVDDLRLRSHLDGPDGRLSVRARLRALRRSAARDVHGVSLELKGDTDEHQSSLTLTPTENGIDLAGELTVPGIEPWWPHTHGIPALYEARLSVRIGEEELSVPAGRVGFRDLRAQGELERDGIQLSINKVPVFARGAVWTPLDLVEPYSRGPELRTVLEAVVTGGMNMLRVPGIGCYESDEFYDLCDELGILVWQDFMFANLDYPEQDAAFMATVEREARQVLDNLGRRPCLAVVCGGSEVAQQVSMLGLDPQLAQGPLYTELLPTLLAEADVQAPYVPSTPWGGDLPFRPGSGVANYYGVGAYLRPLDDARRSEVKFAAESLAFSNVPVEEALVALGDPLVHDPRWKAGVPRDVGAGWDFEDVRDHYLRTLYELDPVALRSVDQERYLELSRHLTGELMAEVFGEWRRAESPCGGALVLWLTDLLPGAGWGLLDSDHRPKVAYHYLKRALSPVAVWSVDEGLGGVVAHVANDSETQLRATLRIATYRDGEMPVEAAQRALAIPSHTATEVNTEELLGRFVDVSWAYRFGPPAQDVIVVSLENGDATRPLSQAFRFPVGRPTRPESASQLGLTATLDSVDQNSATVTVRTRRLAWGVRLFVAGLVPEDDAFNVEPGHARTIRLRRSCVPKANAPDAAAAAPAPDSAHTPTETAAKGHLIALNLAGRVAIAGPQPGRRAS